MLRLSKIVCFIVLILIICNGFVFAYDEPDQILIIHSYNDRYTWTADVMSGIMDILDVYYKDVEIRVEYMDTKNINSDSYYKEFYDMMKVKYENVSIDAIISSDDNAFGFLLEHRDSLFKEVPIFFCGINRMDIHDVDGVKDIYGVVEHKSTYETVQIALKQNPNINKIYIVMDDTVTGQAEVKNIKTELKDLERIELDFMEGKSLNEILETLENVDKNAIVLYGFYIVDKDNKVYPAADTTRMVSDASPVPVYGLSHFSIGHGIVGGKLAYGYHHGADATSLMIDYYKGRSFGGQQYVEYMKSNVHMYDYKVLSKFNMDLGKLPTESTIINKPVTFYEKHKEVIIGSVIIITILIIYNGLLRIQVNRRTSDLNNSLKRLEETQEQLIESEKMASMGGLIVGVAHEMNTPIGNAITVASFIKKESTDIKVKIDDGHLKKRDIFDYMDTVNDSSDMLLNNLESTANMVNVFKGIASGHKTNEIIEFNLKDQLMNLILMYQAKTDIANHKIDLICPDSIKIVGKPSVYFHFVENLISNSFVHGFENMENGLIEIDVDINEDNLNIVYRDNGKGIPQSNRPHIFEAFYTEKRGRGHTGLGLFTVYNSIKSLKGEIKLINNKSVGATFEIKIPLVHS